MKTRQKYIFFPALVALFVTGCAAPLTTDIDYNEPDPLVFINTAFLNQMHTLSIWKSLDSRANRIQTADNYRQLQRWSCIETQAVQNMVTQYCSSKGGIFRNDWCVDSRTEEPLFSMKLEKKTYESLRQQYQYVKDLSDFTQCNLGGERMEITAYAPREDSTKAQWNSAAHSLGFRTVSEHKTEINRRHKEDLARIEKINSQRRQNYRVMMAPNSKGLQVCKRFQGDLYVGVIEETAPAQGTMKVFIGKLCNYSGTHCFSRIGNSFTQHSEWVSAETEGWYPCR